MDLPVWQEMRTELAPLGVEIVTVALDTAGLDAVRSWVERAKPEHPTLLDAAHVTDELFGFVNVPNAVWIDEEGRIVRHAHPATPRTENVLGQMKIPDNLPPVMAETLAEAKKIRPIDGAKYREALRDWAANGATSRYALDAEEVRRRSGERTREAAEAAAAFELGQHLWRSGDEEAAVPWFREAHRLQPDNWTYKRQAWVFVDPLQGANEVYEGNWLADIKKIGAENYYPPLDFD
jgi:hypothetical protein